MHGFNGSDKLQLAMEYSIERRIQPAVIVQSQRYAFRSAAKIVGLQFTLNCTRAPHLTVVDRYLNNKLRKIQQLINLIMNNHLFETGQYCNVI